MKTTEIVVTDALARRFWAKVNRVSDEHSCWNWTGHVGRGDGYGRLRGAGREGSALVASRVSYAMHYGEMPAGALVLHRCIGNRRCVRPDHLYLGDGNRNALDAVEQGRHVSHVAPDSWNGTRNAAAKLTDSQVLAIRDAARRGAMSQRAIAADYGISEAAVSVIVNRKRWTHL